MKTRSGILLGLLAVTTASLGARDAGAVGEQNGRIKGTVSEAQSGIALPGVTVTAHSPSLIGGPRTVGTTDGGRYEIVNLPPGAYTVEISYAGAKPMLRQVVIRPGETAPLIFTAFGNTFWSVSPTQPIAALPMQIYLYATSAYDEQHAQAWAGALVLLGLVLIISLAARFATIWSDS